MRHGAKSFLRSGARPLVYITLIAIFAAAPFLTKNNYFVHLLILWGVYTVLTLSQNMVTGLAGQLSIAQAAFFGIGAYTSAILSMKLSLGFPVAFLAAGLFSSFLGAVIAMPILRLRGIYFGLATYAFGEIIFVIFENWDAVTGGYVGIRGIPPAKIGALSLSSQQHYYFFVIALVLFSILCFTRLARSHSGLVLMALREDEMAAHATGINATKFKIFAFAYSTFFAGLAGSFFAHYISYISPSNFSSMESITIITMYILGGSGSVAGSIGGAGVLTILPEMLRVASSFRIVIYGSLLVAIAIFRPQGLFGTISLGRLLAPAGRSELALRR